MTRATVHFDVSSYCKILAQELLRRHTAACCPRQLSAGIIGKRHTDWSLKMGIQMEFSASGEPESILIIIQE
jgi:hypothetical protein